MFIVFIPDLNSTWQDLAQNCGIVIDAKIGTTIIVDAIFSWVSALYLTGGHSLFDLPLPGLSSTKFITFSQKMRLLPRMWNLYALTDVMMLIT